MFNVRCSTFDVFTGKGGGMKIVPFVAENAANALAQIHEKLGPDAVVLSIRRLPAQGVAWLWNRQGHVEVLAAVLTERETAEAATSLPEVLETSRHKWDDSIDLNPPTENTMRSRSWRSITWLESLGLLPAFANVLEERVSARQGEKPPTSPTAEWSAVRAALMEFWRPAAKDTKRTHVFIGPPGSGKTTVLCKWLTASVLSEEHTARAWRLDGVSANTSEFLSVHCEMLAVPIFRYWNENDAPAEVGFVDLPGVECNDSRGLAALREQISALPSPRVHLVLNAAYETSVLFEQYRAFAALKPDDLIFTHLDEERQRVKLWNFVLGTNCSIQFLSAGQKIPGEFLRAESALLFPQENRL
jgi:flagellar biosynthesis protein FlhF